MPDQWDQIAQKVKGRSLKAQDDNAKLDQIRSKLRGVELDLSNKNQPVTADLIQQHYLGKSNQQLTFLQVYDRFLEKQSKKVGFEVSEATFEVYHIRRNNLELFLQSIKLDNLPPDEFNNRQAEEFFLFLRSAKNCSQDYTMKNLQTIKQLLRFAVKEEIILRNPMEGFAFKFDKIKTPSYLTDEEISRLAAHPYTSELLQKVADLFIFKVRWYKTMQFIARL